MNHDYVLRHTVVTDDLFIRNSDVLMRGDEHKVIFDRPGEYIFYSSLYPEFEKGIIKVNEVKRGRKFRDSLKDELQQAKAEIINLKQRLFGKKSEKNARKDGGPNKRSSSTRNKGQQPGSTGHGRTPRPNLPVIEEIRDVASEEKYCSVCGCTRPEFFKTEDSEIVEAPKMKSKSAG